MKPRKWNPNPKIKELPLTQIGEWELMLRSYTGMGDENGLSEWGVQQGQGQTDSVCQGSGAELYVKLGSSGNLV